MSYDVVMVTGAAGFIGSNLCRSLLGRGYKVIGLDNFATGRKVNLAGLKGKDGFDFIEADINNLESLKKSMEGVNYVLHQAAIPSVPRSVADPIASNRANVDGTLNVLVAARDCRVEKVVFASSSSVYGNSPTLPKCEEMAPNPLSPYALNKLTGEIYCRLFNELYGLSTIALRYFNVFGPRQDPESQYAAVIPKFIKSIVNDEPPIIYGDGTQTRDFTYIEDVVSANVKAMESAATGHYNIAGGNRTSLIELVGLINEILGKDIEPVFTSERVGDVKHSLADVNKAKEAFKYTPEYSLEEGLRRTAEWFTI